MTTQKVSVTEHKNIKPNTMFRFAYAGQNYLLANINGQIHAIDDLCTHEDASLYNGALKGDCVECPLHSSHFSFITGQPQQAPATEALTVYPCTIEGGIVFIEITM